MDDPNDKSAPDYQSILNQYAQSQSHLPETPPTPVLESGFESQIKSGTIKPRPDVFKLLFIFSLVCFLATCLYAIFSLIKNSQFFSSKPIPVPTVVPTPVPLSACHLNDQDYPINSSFPSADGCNTCTCSPNLQIMCTMMACQITPPASSPDDIPADWKTYENKEYEFSFKYPLNLTVTENVQTNHTQIFVGNIFVIKIQKNYPVNQPKYYLDSESNGERNIGNINWKTFYLKDGYSDGGAVSNIPIYALQIEKNKFLYSVSGFTSPTLTSSQLQILSTFKFTNQNEIPQPISSLFTKINQTIGKKINPVYVDMNYFFQNGIYSTKKVWQIDLSEYSANKEQILKIINTITEFGLTQNSAADGGDASVITYTSSDMDCTYNQQASTVKLSCAVK